MSSSEASTPCAANASRATSTSFARLARASARSGRSDVVTGPPLNGRCLRLVLPTGGLLHMIAPSIKRRLPPYIEGLFHDPDHPVPARDRFDAAAVPSRVGPLDHRHLPDNADP